MTVVIFDCDGVVVDSEVIALEVLTQMLSDLDRPMTIAECRRRFMGRSTGDVMAEVEAMLGKPVPAEVGERAKTLLFERLRRELRSVRDVPETVAWLPYPVCVASSSQPERINLSLAVTGLTPLFANRVFSAADVPHGKPAPDLFLHVAAKLGVAPADCIVIEDSVAGVTAALRAGMGIIGFAGGSHADADLAAELAGAGAHNVVTEMAELPAAVERVRRERAAGFASER